MAFMGLGYVEIIMIGSIFVFVVAMPALLLLFLVSRMRRHNKGINAHEASPFFSTDFIENQRKILSMLQQGKINIDDSEKLLAEINKKALLETPPSSIAKPLRRSSENQMIGGVCGAIADYFSISSNLVRLGFVLVAIITGFFSMIIFYIIAVLVIPYDKCKEVALNGNNEICA